VLRNGEEVELPLADIVPDDVVLLAAGDLIPADATVVESKDLFTNESALTGEVGLALCSNIAAWLMHLQPPVSGIFIKALLIYSIAVPFESTNHIILRSFYALKNTGWPALSSVTSGAVAVSTGFALIDSLGVYALAVAYIVGQISQTILLGLAFKGLVRRTMVE
jgi:hypothetical protein